MKQRRLFVSVFAFLIAAGLSGFVLYQAYSHASAGSAAVQTVPVVVAKIPITAGVKLDKATNIAIAQYPAAALVPGSSLTDLAQADGQYISVSLPQGAPVLTSFLLSEAPSAANTVTRAPLPIDKGMEALSVPFDPSKDVGGYIQPEDHLDILVDTGGGNIHYGFEDVRVLRVNLPAGASAGTIVIELTPEKTAALSYLYADNPTAVVRFVLRPSSANNTGKLPAANAVGPGSWQQHLDG